MACPSCAAGLRVTGKWQRTHPCEFCKTEVFLPDALWKRLHPVRTARHWGVRFEGKTTAQVEAERKHEREREELAGRAERFRSPPTGTQALCVYQIQMAQKNDYDPAAVRLAVFDIKTALRGRWGGAQLATQVEKLLNAGNAKRAIMLVQHVGDLWRTRTIVVLGVLSVSVSVAILAGIGWL